MSENRQWVVCTHLHTIHVDHPNTKGTHVIHPYALQEVHAMQRFVVTTPSNSDAIPRNYDIKYPLLRSGAGLKMSPIGFLGGGRGDTLMFHLGISYLACPQVFPQTVVLYYYYTVNSTAGLNSVKM